MYLFPAHHYHRLNEGRRPSPHERKKRSSGSKRTKHHPYEERVKMRSKIREADIRRKTRTKAISDFLGREMPDTSNRVLTSSAIQSYQYS